MSVRAQLGSRLRAARSMAGWSLRELEVRSGVSFGEIGRLERGEVESPELWTILRLQVALGVPSIELLLGDMAAFPSFEALPQEGGSAVA